MGALYPDYLCWCRGKSLKTGEWVYGNYVQMVVDSEIRPYIYPFPKHANSGSHSYTPQPVECRPGTLQRSSRMTDVNYEEIFEGDIVRLPSGQTGRVVFELGTWGVGVGPTIDYEALEEIVRKERGSSSNFLWNDNFISFYELIDNFCPEGAYDSGCYALEVITDENGEKM